MDVTEMRRRPVVGAGTDDREVLQGVAQAKPEAFHRFFERWLPCVHAASLRALGERSAAEAVCRATLTRAVEEAAALPADADVARFLLRLTREEIGRRLGRGDAPR